MLSSHEDIEAKINAAELSDREAYLTNDTKIVVPPISLSRARGLLKRMRSSNVIRDDRVSRIESIRKNLKTKSSHRSLTSLLKLAPSDHNSTLRLNSELESRLSLTRESSKRNRFHSLITSQINSPTGSPVRAIADHPFTLSDPRV